MQDPPSKPWSEVPSADATGKVEEQPTATLGALPRGTSELPMPVRGGAVGRYLVVDQLGQGGMGVVLSAYDPELNRKVAIKLLQARAGGSAQQVSDGQARLLREAQALAQLSHPNVISVYDVGTWEGRVFIAMEYVEGETLGAWMRSGPHPWREVLTRFKAAARGVAAAHQAGLVHRDFKPDNVLLGKDGRVRVLDFGLARLVNSPEERAAQLVSAGSGSGEVSSDRLSEPLTQAGVVIGTAAYIAPELFSGSPADARSDQFAFSVALWEALYGQRPFPRKPASASERFALQEPPRKALVPSWVRRVVARGLSFDPAARFPSMEALLDELEKDPAQRRKWVLLAAAVVALVVGVALVAPRVSSRARLCVGSEQRLNGIWDAPRKQAMEAAFSATGKSYAADTWARVQQALDEYTHAWVAMRTDVCQATRVRGDQSDETMSLRDECLDQRLSEVSALTDVLLKPDAAVLGQAARASLSLSPLAGCSNVAALRAPVPVPKNPTVQAQVNALRRQLAEGKALLDSAQYAKGMALVVPLSEPVEALKYHPLEAELFQLRGMLEEKSGKFKEAQGSFERSLFAAEAGGHRSAAAMSSAWLTRQKMLLSDFDAVPTWEAHTRGNLELLGGDPRAEGFLEMAVGSMYVREHKNDLALVRFQRALALREKALGPNHPDVAAAHNNLGAALSNLGRREEGKQEFVKALDIWTRALGPTHPETANSILNLGVVLRDSGQRREGLAYLERGLKAREAALGPEHESVAAALQMVAAEQVDLGDNEAALQIVARCLAVYAKSIGPDSLNSAECMSTQALALDHLGRHADSLATFIQLLAIREKKLPPGSVVIADAHLDIAEQLMALGRLKEAYPHLQEAQTLLDKHPSGSPLDPHLGWQTTAVYWALNKQPKKAEALYAQSIAAVEKQLGPKAPELVFPLRGMGESQLAQKHTAEAVATFKRLLEVSVAGEASPQSLGETRLQLAKAMVAAKEDTGAALELAGKAKEDFLAAKDAGGVRSAEAFLEEHRK